MKPLMATKVQRDNGRDEAKTLREWESADSHLTYAGRDAFKRRQDERTKAAQRDTAEAKAKTVSIRKRSA